MNIFNNCRLRPFKRFGFLFPFDNAKLLFPTHQAKYSCIIVLDNRVGKTGHEKWSRTFQYLLIGIFERNPSVKIAQFVFQVTIDVSRRLEIKASAGVV